MEGERSIVLQKKMILFLSLIIGAILGSIYAREIKIEEKNIYLSKLDIITVKVNEEEDEIQKQNVKYLMAKVIKEENNIVEACAGDVTNIVEEKKEVANKDIIFVEEELENKATEIEEIPQITEEIVEEIKEEKVEQIEQISKESEEITNEEIILEKPKTVRYRDLAENNPPTEYIKVVEANATAYCLCKKCCGKSPDHPYYGYTHSGIKIEQGTGIKVIAVDPNVIPLKSKVYVEGLYGAWDYGHAIAADTGSAIKELKIDLYMDTHEEALQWGRKKVKVYILGE